ICIQLKKHALENNENSETVAISQKENPYSMRAALEKDKIILDATVAALKSLEPRTTGTISSNPFEKVELIVQERIDALRPAVEAVMMWENFKNATYVTGSILLTYFGTLLGFGFFWVVIMLFMVGGAFWRNMAKVKKRLRNDIRREIAYSK
ncbi:hypothetical protein HK096_005473, partial [Nowakowskiella sp. JEL0078]